MPEQRGQADVNVAAAWARLTGAGRGVARSAAVLKLRAALRFGGGSVAEFGGTPCSRIRADHGQLDAEQDRDTDASRSQGGDETAPDQK